MWVPAAFVERYGAAIFTLPDYVQPDLELDTLAYIAPSIDPLSPKNAPMEPSAADEVIRRFGIDPIVRSCCRSAGSTRGRTPRA